MTADPLSLATHGLFSSLGGVTKGLLETELHPRTEIRKHIVERLQFESTAAGRVYASRLLPLEDEDLAKVGPVILVYTEDDPVGPDEVSSVIDRNELEVVVEIVAASALADLQDALDAIELAVRSVVMQDETQGGHAAGTKFISSRFTQTGEGAYPLGGQRLLFQVEYQLSFADLVTDQLGTIGAEWDLPTPDGDPEAEDEINFPKE